MPLREITTVPGKSSILVLVFVLTLRPAQRLNCYRSIGIKTNRAGIRLHQEFAEGVARVLKGAFVVAVSIPDANRSVGEFKKYNCEILASYNGI